MSSRTCFNSMENKKSIDALFTNATEGILVINKLGEIVVINPSAEKLFGYGEKELIGEKIERLIPSRFSGKHEGYRENYTQNPHPRSMGAGIELYGLKKDGTEFPVEISLSPYAKSKSKFVIAFIIDITVRKKSEEQLKNYSIDLQNQVKNRTLILEEAIEELEKTKKNLNAALEKERELNELKSRFVSMASHEFRTPLTTMMSSLALVKRYRSLNDEVNEDKFLNKIEQSINNLTDMLDDFLSVSKLEEGKVINLPELFNMKLFLEDVITEMQSTTKKHQLYYEHTGNEQLHLDKKLLKNILFNLLSNAIKFSPKGTPVTIRSTVQKNSVEIVVTDQGIGISEEDQKQLFERFFRAQNATHIQGTGLGLNILAKYVELMNGAIQFESIEKKGTTFKIRFPIT